MSGEFFIDTSPQYPNEDYSIFSETDLPVWPLRKINGKKFTKEEIESLVKRINEESVPK